MLLRSVLEISSRRFIRRIPRQVITQTPPFISSTKKFSTASKQKRAPQSGSTGEPSKPESSLSKVVVGSVAIGAAVLAAYQTGYIDQIVGNKEQKSSVEVDETSIEKRDEKDLQHLVGRRLGSPNSEISENLNPNGEYADQKVETNPHLAHLEASAEGKSDNLSQFQYNSNTRPNEGDDPVEEKAFPEDMQSSRESNDQKTDSRISHEEVIDMKSTEENTITGLDEGAQTTTISTEDGMAVGENSKKTVPPQHVAAEGKLEDSLDELFELPSSLLEAYHLKDEADISSLNRQGIDEYNKFHKEAEDFISAIDELKDGYISKDGKLVLDFLQAIHAAEKRQADLDARLFAEEKRALKERYDKELKDAGVRELMLSEEAAMLDKELKRERAKAAAALKSLQEKLEEKLQRELEQKENEAEQKLTEIKELAKAELDSAIASEKAAQIEKMAEANLHINALCMAFYARSEEARRSHSAQKLALGALAVEDALSRGLPIQAEIDALRNNIQGIDQDSNLDLVLSSIPEDILCHGIDTLLQLNNKFDSLKATLRHFSLIPPGGGGILAHSLAHVASWLKVKEAARAGDGIESVINRVEAYLAEGKLAEAAESLEDGVRGTQAADIVGDWVKRARNRAITEQALTLLQSYATSLSLT